jgi:hypothetical protein
MEKRSFSAPPAVQQLSSASRISRRLPRGKSGEDYVCNFFLWSDRALKEE